MRILPSQAYHYITSGTETFGGRRSYVYHKVMCILPVTCNVGKGELIPLGQWYFNSCSDFYFVGHDHNTLVTIVCKASRDYSPAHSTSLNS